ncbi:MAG: hypothetical protein ACI9FB_002588 [Candidatus Azotimanducaceae bacterium]|jgi:hypothetical protein
MEQLIGRFKSIKSPLPLVYTSAKKGQVKRFIALESFEYNEIARSHGPDHSYEFRHPMRVYCRLDVAGWR